MTWLSTAALYGFWKGNSLLGWGCLGLEAINTYMCKDDEKNNEKIRAWKREFMAWAFGNDWHQVPEGFYIWRWNKRHGHILRLNEKAPLEQNLAKMAKRFNALYY